MANILAVGVATIDWIQVVDEYPAVDTELRAREQHLWRGGNATNTLVVLSQLGHTCSWLGTLADDTFADLICRDLDKYNINYSHCHRVPDSVSPSSHILLSEASGSRNIVHYRELPELLAADASDIDYTKWDWLHFEGRNVAETALLMQQVRSQVPNVTISLELEKPRDRIEQLFGYADVLLCGQHFARAHGHNSGEGFLKAMQTDLPGTCEMICAWGKQGAFFMSENGEVLTVPAFAQEKVIDSRAAGDVFNAAYIDARVQGLSLAESIESACKLAGHKCGHQGLDGFV